MKLKGEQMMKWKRCLSTILVLIMVLSMCPVTSYAQQIILEESIEEELAYIKGRPLTKEEIEEQKSHVPKMHDLSVPVEPIVSESQKAPLSDEKSRVMTSRSYDSRALELVTRVKDQGQWGTCWAFSAVSAIETAAIKAGLADKDVDYSEQHLAYFYYNRVTDPLWNTTGDVNKTGDSSDANAYLDVGGNSFMTAIALSGWMGPATEELVPYSPYSIPEIPQDGMAYTNEVIVKNSYWVPNNNTAIKNAITKYGSVSIMYGHQDEGLFYNYDTAAYYSPMPGVNHLVTIIGWDDDYLTSNFNPLNQPDSNGAWIVKNSWGEEWGDEGIFYLSYENQSMVNILAYEVESKENFDHNYYYDGTSGLEARYVDNNGSISNIYQATGNSSTGGDETLSRVQFTLFSADVTYSIQVYKGLITTSDPTSGTAALSAPVQGITGEGGTYSIDLNQAITLPRGTFYSIVITLSGPNGYVVFAVEEDQLSYGWIEFEAQIDQEQSFIKSTSSSSWEDLADYNQCARIKAFTNNGIDASSISLDQTSKKINKGTQFTLVSTVIPENTTNKTIRWSTSNNKIATVSHGNVTAIGKGTATITATTTSGKKATCVVTVKVPSTKVSINKTKATIYKGQKHALKKTITPFDTTDDIVWKTSNKKVATVTSKGVVKGIKKGKVNITVTTTSGKKATCTITVKEVASKSVKLNRSKATLKKGEKVTLKATVIPRKFTDNVVWRTSNKKVATVKNGSVTAVRKGTATITIKVGNKTAKCKVIVK